MCGSQRILLGVSDNLAENPSVIEFITNNDKKGNQVTVIPDPDLEITKALETAGYEKKFDELGRRMMGTKEEENIICQVMEQKTKRVLELLKTAGTKATFVFPPIYYLNGKKIPASADDFAKAHELGFDQVIVICIFDELEDKKKKFKGYHRTIVTTL